MESFIIKGVKYNVVMSKTAEEVEAAGHKNLAREMRRYSIARSLHLQKPKGNVVYQVYQYTTGNLGKMTRLARMPNMSNS